MKDHTGVRVPSHTDTWQDWTAEEWIFLSWTVHTVVVKNLILKKARAELEAFNKYYEEYRSTQKHKRGEFKYAGKKDHIEALETWLWEATRFSGREY